MYNIPSLEELSTYKIEGYVYFDLSKASFKSIRIPLYQYIISQEERMRLDIVSNNLYGTSDNQDVLMFINNIKNKYKITENMIILYPISDYIDSFRERIDKGDEIRNVISDNRNKKRIDTKRVLFKQNLPPTITEEDYNPITTIDGKLVIGKGILSV
jgi:hypothetical protein